MKKYLNLFLLLWGICVASSCSKHEDLNLLFSEGISEVSSFSIEDNYTLDGYFTTNESEVYYFRASKLYEPTPVALSFPGTVYYPNHTSKETTAEWDMRAYEMADAFALQPGDRTLLPSSFRLDAINPQEPLSKPLVYYGLDGYVSNETTTIFTGANLWKPTLELRERAPALKNIFLKINSGDGFIDYKYKVSITKNNMPNNY